MATTDEDIDGGALKGVVAVGASAGGVEALTNLVGNLPTDLPYAALVALHMPPGAPSVLAKIIDRAGPLPAVAAEDGMTLEAGHIYVAVPDRHLLVHDDRVALSEGPTENGHRPAINALFRSVALNFGPRGLGVLLSGVLDDGVRGAADIKARGGTTVVQTPDDALFPAMPINALRAGVVDHQAPAVDIGPLLKDLSQRVIEDRDMEPDTTMELENRIAMARRFSPQFTADELGPPSGYTCPDCNGSLTIISDQNYRCRVGHAWTADALLSARDDEIDTALWTAVRSLREKADLSRRLAHDVGPGELASRYVALAEEAENAVALLGERLAENSPAEGERGAS
ncbi:chemotaxis protein CheB [Mycobacterium sp. 1274761.0]|uniref:chemotaxis protein CheB n=1 Tax=Mycobacterium sp. 1274761.0 TaxID=1834077 RepID=UPI0007FE4DE0|nr:chemotaxis protein CheB [Mycobacterium sp. 1274761.0]OBK74892.1 protein-glutamate methylesterase [Mycobacterium sp. 1274761.0]